MPSVVVPWRTQKISPARTGRLLAHAREVQHYELETQGVPHLFEPPLGQMAEAGRAHERARHTAERSERGEEFRAGLVRLHGGLSGGPRLRGHGRSHHTSVKPWPTNPYAC